MNDNDNDDDDDDDDDDGDDNNNNGCRNLPINHFHHITLGLSGYTQLAVANVSACSDEN
jgi:hypothetical protein